MVPLLARCSFLALFALVLVAADYPTLAGWGTETLEPGGEQRATICLNGVWSFHPGERNAADAGWGEIRVPGAWAARQIMAGVTKLGSGTAWAGCELGNKADAWRKIAVATYGRRLAVPADWAGRHILLDLRRVGTDAQVLLDGVAVGSVASPAGVVDLSGKLTAGTAPWLEVVVQAAASTEEVTVFMGAAADQVFKKKADLRCRGLLGDVLLSCEPAGAHCDDVFVRTSVRESRVDLDLACPGVADGQLAVTARMLGADGTTVEKTFSGSAVVSAGRTTVGWPWADARRWDLGQPELYTLDLELSGAGFHDRVRQEFGFKELWIDGKRLLLNGSEFHPRPYALVNESDRDWGVSELIDGAIAGMRGAGFDCQELWPWDYSERGVPEWHDLWYERAKRSGWGMIASLQDSRQILGSAWRDPRKRAAWQATVRDQMKRNRNNPAILMWVHTPNVYGLWNDQDPRLLGQQAKLMAQSRSEGKDLVPGLEANTFIRTLDPTRPVFTHHGGAVGDVHTANTYPCLAQPQEQAEWLSEWAEHGEVPYWAVEFGPFVLDYRRGRLTGGWGQPFGAIHTELQATEQLAAWYGRAAYASETPALRALNPQYFEQDQKYRQIPDSWRPDQPLADVHMAEQLAEVFRAWRTMGTTFSPLPWEGEWGWDHSQNAAGQDIRSARVPLPTFVPGRRGLWFPELEMKSARFLQPEGAKPLARAEVFAADNGPTLAWICAPPNSSDVAAFTAKDHSYASGAIFAKAIALLNDSRVEAAAGVYWEVIVAGQVIAHDSVASTMATGTRQFVPLSVTLPTVSERSEGEVRCTTVIAGRTQHDRFAFRVFPPAASLALTAQVLDPAGASRPTLANLGVVDGTVGAPVRIIGRQALASGAVALADQEAWVRAGGRLLVLAQDPEWIRKRIGWHIGYQVLRRVFPCEASGDLLSGLDERDLRDWNGSGTLIAARPPIDSDNRGGARYPTHTWHWGNRGSVCSAPIEKPQRSAWRALLECDFDLASTPVMELDVGRGRITWCQLDLEARGAADPALQRLAANLLRHVAEAPLQPVAGTARYLGNDADRAFLSELGVLLSEQGGPLVVGVGADPATVARAVQAGDSVVALAAAPLGLASATNAKWPGAADLPTWPALRGLTPSDLRRGVDGPQELLPATAGWELAADGLFARPSGASRVLLCLADPRALPADVKTYFRFARWHLTRTLCQVLANHGVGFAADQALWQAVPAAEPPAETIQLAGTWMARLVVPLPAATDANNKHPETPPSAAAKAAALPAFDDHDWEPRELPGNWARWGAGWADRDGEGVFRRWVEVPAGFAARPAIDIELGPIDDVDTVWINGVEVGHTGTDKPEFWSRPRSYRLPPGLLKPGRNLIVVRDLDLYGDGMVGEGAQAFRLVAPQPPRRDGWYYPDEERRHEVADDPHRYYRW